MSNRTFTRAELAAYGVPPDRPGDVDGDTVLLDEALCTLKYSQSRRCVFRADDGRMYGVQYEAPVDAGDYETGPGPDDHGWHGDAIATVEVEQRPETVMRWVPVDAPPTSRDARPARHG
ncbi:hypothetical protein VSR01_16540 [Actinacidiphila sp. DG2A-62]|uniref:hypothetical protein n=1 Tax=Actinacidiphila sp. DG2A-62 TaxID=3108821 RepID=UPI002DBC02BA|nr:hypothetical protein [Actinacidiphila sp. DG2A-62]MEC3995055.1 hypothetical protein [Actinacidiphila sp. DG2A-62]